MFTIRTVPRVADRQGLACAVVWLGLAAGTLGCGSGGAVQVDSVDTATTATAQESLTTTSQSSWSSVVTSLSTIASSTVEPTEEPTGPSESESNTASTEPQAPEVDSSTTTTAVSSASAGSSVGAVVVAHVVSEVVAPRQEPNLEAPIITTLANPTETGGPLVFQAVDNRLSPDGRWIEVYLPIRPNGSTGWIQLDAVKLHANPFRLSIDSAGFTLTLFKNDQLVLSTPIGIGTGDTPTPVGQFFVIELLKPPSPDGPYGPFAFGLSGFSETLTSFGDGAGVIGIHGTNDPGSIGTNASHGCIRVANDVITELAQVLPLGTPVVIS